MSAPRRLIDARVHPVVITDCPPRETAVAVRRSAETTVSTRRAARALSGRAPVRRRVGRALIASAAGTLVAASSLGFAAGYAGWGLEALRELAAAVLAVVVALAGAGFLLSRGGAAGPHCPGPWHR